MTPTYRHVFLDCMPGPTHHFGGYSYGNIASMSSKDAIANPKKMALEWLDKIRTVVTIGAPQVILPPHPVHASNTQHSMNSAYTWMANSGHFTPSCDTYLNQALFTPSNMIQTMHRNQEHRWNRLAMHRLLSDSVRIFQPLSASDEGSANHVRLSNDAMNDGLNVYVASDSSSVFPARQSRDSIDALIASHQIKRSFILTQHKTVMDAGVFHNDIICFGFKQFLFCDYRAFHDQSNQLHELSNVYNNLFNAPLHIYEDRTLSLDDIVSSYIYNAQVIVHNQQHWLICPSSVRTNHAAMMLVNSWLATGIFDGIYYVNLSQSLKNGGGPACLRLAMMLTDDEYEQLPVANIATKKRLVDLQSYVTDHYPSNMSICNDISTIHAIHEGVCNQFK